MRLPPRSLAFFTSACCLLPGAPARAVAIRSLDFARDVRLAWMPDQHLENSAFPLGQDKVRGIGWPEQSTGEWHRQMTLISPIHFLFANHYAVDSSWHLSFQMADGTLCDRPILSTQTVLNSQGQPTDLLLGTLQSPIHYADTGIAPFPVANLGADANYLGQRAWVFGKVAIAGRGTMAGFSTLTEAGFDHTRYIYFDYKTASGAGDDCYFESGDSGSPTFIVENGQPALIGTHSYENPISGGHRSYDAFVPDYIPQLDALMEAQGYHVKRLHPASTGLIGLLTATSALNPGQPGSFTFGVANAGNFAADNLVYTLTFSRPPDTLSGTGWFCEETAPGVWSCHKAGLATNANSNLIATWTNVGPAGKIDYTSNLQWDGGGSGSVTSNSRPVGYYADWAKSLPNSDPVVDPDQDGVANLLEYAFGGDPAQAITTTVGGAHPLLPYLAGNSIHYAHRTDAAARSLVYHLETSTDLVNWTESLPAGAATVSQPFSPAISGFEEVVVTFPPEFQRYFRLRIELTE